jgi:hypothetical protein
VAAALFTQQVVHVFEEFQVPALVAGDRYRLGVFLNGRVHNLLHAAVVAQVDDLAPLACRMRRMMLMAASWPSNRLPAVTMRILLVGE